MLTGTHGHPRAHPTPRAHGHTGTPKPTGTRAHGHTGKAAYRTRLPSPETARVQRRGSAAQRFFCLEESGETEESTLTGEYAYTILYQTVLRAAREDVYHRPTSGFFLQLFLFRVFRYISTSWRVLLSPQKKSNNCKSPQGCPLPLAFIPPVTRMMVSRPERSVTSSAANGREAASGQ